MVIIMKKLLGAAGSLLCVFLLLALFGGSSLNKELWKEKQCFWKINQSQIGDYQDQAEDWKNSKAFKNIYKELEREYNAFICSTWNYDIIDGKPRYEKTEHGDIPIEYDYYGYSFIVSENYFDYTPIQDINGVDIQRLLTDKEDTLDVLVLEKYKDDASLINSIYQEFMYFNNVEVENIYNEKLNKKINEKKAEDFNINIIYVPDSTEYDVYNPAIKRDKLNNCIAIVINAENYNMVQLNSISNQGFYVQSDFDKMNIESKIKSVYEKNKCKDGYHSIVSVKDLYDEFENEQRAEIFVTGVLGIICILIIMGGVFFIRKSIRKSKEK